MIAQVKHRLTTCRLGFRPVSTVTTLSEKLRQEAFKKVATVTLETDDPLAALPDLPAVDFDSATPAAASGSSSGGTAGKGSQGQRQPQKSLLGSSSAGGRDRDNESKAKPKKIKNVKVPLLVSTCQSIESVGDRWLVSLVRWCEWLV